MYVWIGLADVLFFYAAVFYAASRRLPYTRIELHLFAWITCLSLTIAAAYGLSWFQALGNAWAWWTAHGAFALAALILAGRRPKRVVSPLPSLSKMFDLWRSLSYPERVLTVTVAASFALVLLHTLVFPPGLNDDAAGYHLPRIGQYLEQGSLQAFPSADRRQTDFPANYEILAVWILAWSGDVRLVSLIHWGALIFALLSLVQICRPLGLSPRTSWVVLCLWAGTPFVLLQMAFVKNDLLMSCLLLNAVPFLFRIPKGGWVFTAVPVMCCALMIGVKYTGCVYALGIWGASLILLNREVFLWKRNALFIAVTGAAGLVLGLPFYIDAWYRTGELWVRFGGGHFFSIHAVSINSIRLFLECSDSVYLPFEIYQRVRGISIADFREPLVDWLSRYPAFNVYDEHTFWDWNGSAQGMLHHHFYQFTLAHCVYLFYGCIVACRVSSSKKVWVLFMLFGFCYLLQAGILSWQLIDMLRFYFPLLSLLYPCAGWSIENRKSGSTCWDWIGVVLIGIGLSAMVYYLFLILPANI